jgi:CDP-paratose 2-epimerase
MASTSSASVRPGPVLITGGAGFVATNLAARLAASGRQVIVFDNLSRPHVERNLQWLRETWGTAVTVRIGDVRDTAAIGPVVRQAAEVYHLAAQVAVTTSLADPCFDFEVNARGTLNLLEAVRACPDPPPVLFTSTNKVYGALGDVVLRAGPTRYEPVNPTVRQFGLPEGRPLEFHSPYGCSKGVAEQYVLDYSRTFGLRTAVFRMSCVYGPHQFGTEDQGWLAHFLLAALREQPITIFGDGLQVRDVLYVDDLVEAMVLAQSAIDCIAGEPFNIGGGPLRSTSLVELLDLVERLTGQRPEVQFEPWRPADQRYYVSDTRRFEMATGWRPRVAVREGLRRLVDWFTAAAGPLAAGSTARMVS